MLTNTRHFWINRDGDHQRKQQTLNWLAQHPVAEQRIQAITPQTLPLVIIERGYASGNTRLEIACLCSHLKAIVTAYQQEETHALILEDDTLSHYLFDTEAIIASAPEDWDILQLKTSNPKIINYQRKLWEQKKIHWDRWDIDAWSCGAYLINAKGIRALVDRFLIGEPDPLSKIDLKSVKKYKGLIADYVLYRSLNTYSCTFPLFVHNPRLGSTLHPDHIDKHHNSAHQMILDLYQTHADKIPFAICELNTLASQ